MKALCLKQSGQELYPQDKHQTQTQRTSLKAQNTKRGGGYNMLHPQAKSDNDNI